MKDLYGPSYYKRGSMDVWDFIRDQDLNFHLGNAIKYVFRAGHKTDTRPRKGNPLPKE